MITEQHILDEVRAAELLKDLGETFLEMRIENDWTQRETAERIGSAQYKVSELEHGNWDPKFSTLVRYASAFGYDIDVRLVPKESFEATCSDGPGNPDRILSRGLVEGGEGIGEERPSNDGTSLH